MSTVINTNPAATAASYHLGQTNQNLQRSLNRLSSGSRINSSYDDAGGLAVSMKLAAAIKRSQACEAGVGNALAFLQTQDGAMATATKVVTRMSELAALALDVTKNDEDLENYNTEFQQLRGEIENIANEKFNGIPLFATNSIYSLHVASDFDAEYLKVITSEDGFQSCDITIPPLNINDGGISQLLYAFYDNSDGIYTYPGDPIHEAMEGMAVHGYSAYYHDRVVEGYGFPMTLSKTSVSVLGGYCELSLQELANMRAQNGAEQSRLEYAKDMLAVNQINLEQANSRIIDVDVASESSQLARFNILQQAGTAMLTQANQSPQSILRLLQLN
jgi:flagellin